MAAGGVTSYGPWCQAPSLRGQFLQTLMAFPARRREPLTLIVPFKCYRPARQAAVISDAPEAFTKPGTVIAVVDGEESVRKAVVRVLQAPDSHAIESGTELTRLGTKVP
jgi:hypothetical protein